MPRDIYKIGKRHPRLRLDRKRDDMSARGKGVGVSWRREGDVDGLRYPPAEDTSHVQLSAER